MTWHAPVGLLTRYATAPGSVDDVTASSIEGHLLTCAQCRAGVSAAVPVATIEAGWAEIADRVDRPRPGFMERFLAVIGVSASTARLIAATRSLQAAWLAATAALVGLVVGLARDAGNPGFFLAIAPVVPLALVAVAFAAGAEPSGDVGRAAPLGGTGLVIRRSLAVLASSLLVLSAGALLMPTLDLAIAAWILPGLGLSLAALALATWVRIEVAAASAALVWLLALEAAHVWGDRRLPLEDLAPLAMPGQVVSAVVIVVAGLALIARRDVYSYGELS